MKIRSHGGVSWVAMRHRRTRPRGFHRPGRSPTRRWPRHAHSRHSPRCGHYRPCHGDGSPAEIRVTAGTRRPELRLSLLNDTHVRLVKPRCRVLRKDRGSKLHFLVRVPGADPNVKVRIEAGKDTLVEGTTNAPGRFFATVPRAIREGNLRVVASVPGADAAISNPIASSTLSRPRTWRAGRCRKAVSRPAGLIARSLLHGYAIP